MWKKTFALYLLLTVVGGGASAAVNVPETQLQFMPRHMKTEFLALQNVDFKEAASVNDSESVMGWKLSSSMDEVHMAEGRNGGKSVFLAGGVNDEGEPREIYQDIELKSLQPTPLTISVSAWVWSNMPGGANLKLSGLKGGGHEALSAFHSGNSEWEYLTVVYPYEQWPEALRISLQSSRGVARFTEVKALATHDDRFVKALPDGCNPLRERVTYAKDGRIRIVVVGNSTVNGHAVADKRASFPYVLQLKLESLFPGRFEVINFGLCGWHLPPQITTLDKAFNSNKACDGAVWCGGKDGQFSHKNVLAMEQNADNNTPTISELKPDVIIFAGMWNDVWRALKYTGWGIPPNPDEVNRVGGEPASVEYLRAVLNYADHPTEENYRQAEKTFEMAMRPLDSSVTSALQLRDYASLRNSAEFQRLVENASTKLAYLSEEFIRRAQQYGQVWAMTLPGRFGDAYGDAAKKLRAGGQLPAEGFDKFLMNGYIDAVTERIQNVEVTRVSKELGAKSLNLSDVFHAEYGAMPISEQLSLGYFLAGIEDNVHFAYRGNEWIADRAFLGFLDELNRLSGSIEHSLPANDRIGELLVR